MKVRAMTVSLSQGQLERLELVYRACVGFALGTCWAVCCQSVDVCHSAAAYSKVH